jgi:hypothetical protein
MEAHDSGQGVPQNEQQVAWRELKRSKLLLQLEAVTSNS